MKDPTLEINIPAEDNIYSWEVTLTGPESTPYADGKFLLGLEFPETYPFKPPKILFKTRIYHPNVKTDSGEICSDLIYSDWGPTLNVKHCLDTLVGILKEPNPDSPLEETIAAQFREKPKEFEKVALKWTKEHAM